MYLEQSRQAWEDQAEGYDRAMTATDMRAAEVALRIAGVRSGTRLLDIAAGPGALSLPAARLGADVLAVDYSNAMVNLLRRKAGALGLSNLHVRVMDGTALEFGDGSFDVACSELGIMLFPDRAKGLREMARVVAPGGRGVMIALGPAKDVEPIWLFFEAMRMSLPGFMPPRDSPLFCLESLERLHLEMARAGFDPVDVRPFETEMTVGTADDLWEMILAGAPAVRGVLQQVARDRQLEIRSALADIIDARAAHQRPLRLRVRFNIAVGTKP